MRAILSASDKTGMAELGQGLATLGWEIFSTGNTHRTLQSAAVQARGIEELTGFPEILDGRVKTLHPAVHGGILARRDQPAHLATLREHNLAPIDLVACNLYPFAEVIARPGSTLDDVLNGDAIDIGGVTLIRAAAKNFPSVLVLIDPDDYAPTLDYLRQGEVPLDWRRRLATKAFSHTAAYDALIARYLQSTVDSSEGAGDDSALFPQQLTIGLEKLQGLRYGENPHQRAAFYRTATPEPTPAGLATVRQLHGRELSYNNIMDADAAWNAANDFAAPCVAIVKHTVPCGLATHADLTEAYHRALSGDPVSAFGGIVAANRTIDAATAAAIAKTHYDIVLAPDFASDALALLQKRRNLRVLACGEPSGSGQRLEVRQILGGALVQTPDRLAEDPREWQVVTKLVPTIGQLADLAFAWLAVKHVKSNGIVIASDQTLRGMGAGQPNRVVSVALAAEKAGELARGAVLASDAFFPFPDGLEAAAAAGVVAVAQPGGSVNDEKVIAAADAAGLAMVFTGMRHFKH
jgi:phosphoribosylaminoimidazolecarboxamide formyltransferase / IMP cyclohydrolase